MSRRHLPPGARCPANKHSCSGKSLPGKSLHYIRRVRTPTPEPERSSSLENPERESRTTTRDDESISSAIPTTSSRMNTPERVEHHEILWRDPISESESSPPTTPELLHQDFGSDSTDYEPISFATSPAADCTPEPENSFMETWKCIKGVASPPPGLLPLDFHTDLPPPELQPSDSRPNIPLLPELQPFNSTSNLSSPKLRPEFNTIHPPKLLLPPSKKHLRASSLYGDIGYRQIRARRKEMNLNYIAMIVGVGQRVAIKQSNINGGSLARSFKYLFHDLERRNLPQCILPFPKANNLWLPEGVSREEHNTFMLLFWNTLPTYSKSLKWWYGQLARRMLLTKADRAALQYPVFKIMDEAEYLQKMYSKVYGALQKIREDDINDFHDAKDEILRLVLSDFETDSFEKLHSLNYENLLSAKIRVDLTYLCSRIRGLAHLCFLLNHPFMDPVRRQIYEPIIEMHTEYTIKEIADHIMGANPQVRNDLAMENVTVSPSGIQNTGFEKSTEMEVEENLSIENAMVPGKYFLSPDCRKKSNQATFLATTEDITTPICHTQSAAKCVNALRTTRRTVTYTNKSVGRPEKQVKNLGTEEATLESDTQSTASMTNKKGNQSTKMVQKCGCGRPSKVLD